MNPDEETSHTTTTDLPDAVTQIKFPSGEVYTFNRRLEPSDLDHVSNIWGNVRKEEILRIEQEAKENILRYLKQKGYKLIFEERLRFT